jgi:hypothetical protein
MQSTKTAMAAYSSRTIQTPIITDEEVAVVKAGMRQYWRLERFIVDVKKNDIVIYTPDQGVDSLADTLSFLACSRNARVKAALEETLTYSPMLQFVLTDKAKRLFETQRYCFMGSIDDWITTGDEDELPRLVKAYVKHMGEESLATHALPSDAFVRMRPPYPNL